ncbi:MAG TPA: hypothetical protein VL633_00585 [Bacteroidota bacterium]|jgi:hypothetical protein|nr:hypothetical protein [Bacteroidota bacterium]
MSGRALIIVVAGIIITTSIIFHNITISSNRIAGNFNNYLLRQSARNIAQSGVNMALRQLETDRTWRTGYTSLATMAGKVSVRLTDITFAGIPNVICVQSTGTIVDTAAVSTAYCYFPQPRVPTVSKGLLTLNGSNQINGSITIDGRDHPSFSSGISPTTGTYGVWTSGSSFSLGSSAGSVGGTVLGIDLAPGNPPPLGTVALNQVYPGGFPQTPDSALGGPTSGFPEGTLKAIAKTGLAGSQYVTDPLKLVYPLRGITYVELPAGGSWTGGSLSSSSGVAGTGILVVHNNSKDAVMKTASGSFAGIVLADDMTNFHAQFWGGIVALTPSPTGNVLGNGSAAMYFSREAISNATGFITTSADLNVIGWWE